jgi:predicted DNA-binding transcriptional regulator AlpA
MNDAETILKAVLTADGDRRARALKVLETGTADALPEPLLTTNQVCERLQVSRATLWRWRLPCVRRGGVRRYRWPDVLTALEKAKPEATAKA